VANPHGVRPQQSEHMGRWRREQQGRGSRSTRGGVRSTRGGGGVATGALEGAVTGALEGAAGALGDGSKDPASELEDRFTRCRIEVRFLVPSRGRRGGSSTRLPPWNTWRTWGR
jgi:hypothetical protein